jgi:hydrogenase maturation protein HypF
VPASAIALRFHQGLSSIIVETADRLAHQKNGAQEFEAVALSGGCFQNRILFEGVAAQLRCKGLTVLTHAEIPANDGGLSLGQAAVAAALLLESRHGLKERTGQCVSVSQGASSK